MSLLKYLLRKIHLMDFKSYAISLKVSLRLTLDSFHLRVKVSYYESCKVTLFLSLFIQFIAKCAISQQEKLDGPSLLACLERREEEVRN